MFSDVTTIWFSGSGREVFDVLMPYPFLRDAFVETTKALLIKEGPTLEEMEQFQVEHDDRRLYQNLPFETSAGQKEVYVTNMSPHPVVPLTWWVVGELADGSGEEVGIYFMPQRLNMSFLAFERDLIYR